MFQLAIRLIHILGFAMMPSNCSLTNRKEINLQNHKLVQIIHVVHDTVYLLAFAWPARRHCHACCPCNPTHLAKTLRVSSSGNQRLRASHSGCTHSRSRKSILAFMVLRILSWSFSSCRYCLIAASLTLYKVVYGNLVPKNCKVYVSVDTKACDHTEAKTRCSKAQGLKVTTHRSSQDQF